MTLVYNIITVTIVKIMADLLRTELSANILLRVRGEWLDSRNDVLLHVNPSDSCPGVWRECTHPPG